MGGGSLNTTGQTTIAAVDVDILQTHILTRLDGPTLASACCSSSQFHALSIEDNLWREICNHKWPSTADPRVRRLISAFPAGHRSFYADTSLSPDHRHRLPPNLRRWLLPNNRPPPPPAYIISAVDINYQNRLIVSKVHETKTGSDISSPFQIDLIGPKEAVSTSVKFDIRDNTCVSNLEENLTITWILIDPTRNRAANILSQRPVSVKRNWSTNEVELRYATVISCDKRGELVQGLVVVTPVGGGLMVKVVRLQVENMERKKLGWKILQEALEGGRKRIGERDEERERYEGWWREERERRQRKRRREKRRELMIIVIGIGIFLSFLGFGSIKFLSLLLKH